MYHQRQLVRYRIPVGRFNTTIVATQVKLIDFHAASYVLQGEVPTAASTDLNGVIDSMIVTLNGATAYDLDVIFLSATRGLTTAGTTDKYIDHESFAKGDFIAGGWNYATATPVWDATKSRRVSRSGLNIPYYDGSHLKTFHIGLRCGGATNIPKDKLQVEFTWRPRMGWD